MRRRLKNIWNKMVDLVSEDPDRASVIGSFVSILGIFLFPHNTFVLLALFFNIWTLFALTLI